ncbi:hypothetical protein GQR58_024061 [Nymphon striatum]|nr:hypothetical protein GQR58_024061 [Nymphon striatum]
MIQIWCWQSDPNLLYLLLVHSTSKRKLCWISLEFGFLSICVLKSLLLLYLLSSLSDNKLQIIRRWLLKTNRYFSQNNSLFHSWARRQSAYLKCFSEVCALYVQVFNLQDYISILLAIHLVRGNLGMRNTSMEREFYADQTLFKD